MANHAPFVSGWRSTGRIRSAPIAAAPMDPLGFALETSTPSASGASRTPTPRLMPPAFSWTAPSSKGRQNCGGCSTGVKSSPGRCRKSCSRMRLAAALTIETLRSCARLHATRLPARPLVGRDSRGHQERAVPPGHGQAERTVEVRSCSHGPDPRSNPQSRRRVRRSLVDRVRGRQRRSLQPSGRGTAPRCGRSWRQRHGTSTCARLTAPPPCTGPCTRRTSM